MAWDPIPFDDIFITRPMMMLKGTGDRKVWLTIIVDSTVYHHPRPSDFIKSCQCQVKELDVTVCSLLQVSFRGPTHHVLNSSVIRCHVMILKKGWHSTIFNIQTPCYQIKRRPVDNNETYPIACIETPGHGSLAHEYPQADVFHHYLLLVAFHVGDWFGCINKRPKGRWQDQFRQGQALLHLHMQG